MPRSQAGLGVTISGSTARLVLIERQDSSVTLRSAQQCHVSDLQRVVRSFPRRPSRVVTAISLEHAAVRHLTLPPTVEENLARVVTLEAESALPLPWEELALSHHVLGMNDQSQLEVMVAAGRQSAIQGLLRHVNCLPWITAEVTVVPAAIQNALQHLRGASREGAVAVLSAGEASAELAVLDRGRIVTTQFLPYGPTEAQPPPEDGGESGLSAAVKGPAWAADSAARLRFVLQSLNYDRGLTIERLYLCGERADEPGADWVLSERLEIPVTRLLIGSGTEGDSEYAPAYGCALQAAGVAATPLNLTPASVSLEREVFQRRQTRLSWVFVTAASVVAAGILYGAALLNRQAALREVKLRGREIAMLNIRPAPNPKDLEASRDAVLEATRVRVPPSQVFSILAEHLPRTAWIAEINYNAATGCVIRGYATEPSAPQVAQIGLLREELFDEVSLDYRNEEKIEGAAVWAFQFTCRLRPEDRRRTPGARSASR